MCALELSSPLRWVVRAPNLLVFQNSSHRLHILIQYNLLSQFQQARSWHSFGQFVLQNFFGSRIHGLHISLFTRVSHELQLDINMFHAARYGLVFDLFNRCLVIVEQFHSRRIFNCNFLDQVLDTQNLFKRAVVVQQTPPLQSAARPPFFVPFRGHEFNYWQPPALAFPFSFSVA